MVLDFSCWRVYVVCMKRRNLFFPEVQWLSLLRLAKKTGITVSEHIRRAVDDYLGRLK